MSFRVSRAAREGRWGPLGDLGRQWVTELWGQGAEGRGLGSWRRWGLSARLAEVAQLIPEGSALVDIGTDHALLPLALTRSGHSPKALGVDINAAPLKGARARFKPDEQVALVLGDGFVGSAEPCEALWVALGAPEHGLCGSVCGVGGAKVASMIPSVPPFIKRLVLQPNLHHERVRGALRRSAWRVTEERLTLEGERIFLTLAAERCGELDPSRYAEEEPSHERWERYDSPLLSHDAWYPLWLWVHLERELELISGAVEHSSAQARRHFDGRRRRAEALMALLQRTTHAQLSSLHSTH